MNILQICKTIRSLWRNGEKDAAWFAYVSVLQDSDSGRLPMDKCWQFDAWQHYDILGSFRYNGGAFRRARGAAKTRDLSAVAVFLRIAVGPVFWFAAVRRQLMKAQDYWLKNPFVETFNKALNKQFIRTVEFDDIECAVMSEKNTRGPRACVLILDESAQMTALIADTAKGITNGMGSEIYIYYGSTPKINTYFQTACDNNEWERIHPFYHCSWFNFEKIMNDKKDMADAMWRQENLAHFTVMDGMVFEENLIRGTYLGLMDTGMYYGSDPNPREGYVVVGGQFNHDQTIFQVTFCKDFGTGASGKTAMIDFLLQQSMNTNTMGIEFETNGAGMPVADDMEAAGVLFNPMFWDDKKKVNRVNDLMGVKLYIPHDPMFNELYNQTAALQWSIDGKKIQKDKNLPYHKADSLLHAAQYSGGVWVYV